MEKLGCLLRVGNGRTGSDSAGQVPDMGDGEPSRSVTRWRRHGSPLIDLAIPSIYDIEDRKDGVQSV
jgi:hypothetical protein